MCRVICIGSFILLLFACDSDRGTNSPRVLNYPEESADAALFYGDELYAPTYLIYQIDHELTLLRDQWGDSIPIVYRSFRLPWRRSNVGFAIDTAYVDSFQTQDWLPWQTIQQKYELTFNLWRAFGETHYGTVTSTQSLNSALMVDFLAGLPGLKGVSTDPLYYPYGEIWVRMELDGIVHYFFESDACPEIYMRYDHFTVDNRRARHWGTHLECPPDVDSLCIADGWLQCYDYMEHWADSARANPPVWLDTAYIAIGRWSWESGASWQREP